MRSVLLAALISAALVAGCVGPNRLQRGLDEQVNQLYVDNPGLSMLLFPFLLVGDVGAKVIDYGLLNPYSFWGDVGREHGTPYYYTDPVVSPGAVDPGPGTASQPGYSDPGYSSSPGTYGVRPVDRYSAPGSRGYATHQVRPGESLSSISRQFYGDASRWKDIYNANRSVVSNPHRVPVGTVLQIPR